VVFGPLKEPEDHGHHHGPKLPRDLSLREILVLTPLAVLCVVLGLYPAPVLRSLEAPTRQTLQMVQGYLPGSIEPEIPEGFDVAPQVSDASGAAPADAPDAQEAGL
jgi:NADH-quinone oxidoreductase subunit M